MDDTVQGIVDVGPALFSHPRVAAIDHILSSLVICFLPMLLYNCFFLVSNFLCIVHVEAMGDNYRGVLSLSLNKFY